MDTSTGTLLASGYDSGDSINAINIDGDEVSSVLANNIAGVSDMFVLVYTAIGGADDVLVSAAWREFF